MAVDQPGNQVSVPAYADYSASGYIAVYLDGTAGRARVTGLHGNAIGILQTKPSAAGMVCTVMTSGISKCIYGAGVTVGDDLMCNASGQLITATSTYPVIGVCMKTGTTSDVGQVLLDVKGPSMGVTAGPAIVMPVRIPLTNLTTDAAYRTAIPISAPGVLTGVYVIPETVASTTGKASTITVSTDAGALTGGVVALTSANCKLTAAIAGTAISGANATVTAANTITLTTSSTTSFSGDTGSVWLYITATA